MAGFFDELKTIKFYKALLAEFIGTLLLVFVGASCCIGGAWKNTVAPEIVSISLCFGITVATIVWCIGHASGGHINPAVSIALAICRRVTLVRAFFYIIVQVLGALAGAALLYVVTPEQNRETLGLTALGSDVVAYQGLIVEAIISLLLVLTVLATCDSRRKDLGGSGALSIGLAVSAAHFGFAKYTGASMNPARSLGVAAIMDMWQDHWIYWVGPILGGVVASFLYETFFGLEASLSNFCCFTIERPQEVLPANAKAAESRIEKPKVDSKTDKKDLEEV